MRFIYLTCQNETTVQEKITVNLTHRVKTLDILNCISKLILMMYKIYVSAMQNTLSIQFIKGIKNAFMIISKETERS